MHRAAPLILVLVLAPQLASCGARRPSETPGNGATSELESAALGLRLTGLPEGVRLAAREGDRLALDAVSDGVPGDLVISVGPRESSGINLVAEAKGFGEAAAAEGGEFFGANQIVTPWGSGYAARVLLGSGATEEIRIFLLHPADGDRLLVLSLSYPPGEPAVSRARMNQALETVAAIEALGPAPDGE